MRTIAGDIGGTKVLLQLRELAGGEWHIRLERRYESGNYPTFQSLLQEFCGLISAPVAAACFAVAGPVVGRKATLTNLEWVIDADEVARAFSISHVLLVNDFFAVAAGVPLLLDADLTTIHPAPRDPAFPVAIIGAGTGLGEASVVPTTAGWKVVPGEGGHCDFAPLDETQTRLFTWLQRRFGHVSYERVVSGQGLENIFTFLRDQSPEIEESLDPTDDLPPRIAALAAEGDPIAIQTFEIFIDVFGAEAGNLALKVLARGGVFIAGGIAAKNVPRFTDGRFLRSFQDKGRMRPLMLQIPVFVITNQKVGLMGAAELSAREAATL